MKISRKTITYENGFTIVELMIALSVLSTILLISSLMLIGIGKMYTKGVNAANLQNASRTISNDVASALQFGGNAPVTNQFHFPPGVVAPNADDHHGNLVYATCVNNVRYSYVIARELGTDSGSQTPSNLLTPHVLWRDTVKNPTFCNPLNILSSSAVPTDANTQDTGYEMAAAHTRLTAFTVQENPAGSSIYLVTTNMAFGDSDLLNLADLSNVSCNGGAGSEFCSLSTLQVSVKKRIE